MLPVSADTTDTSVIHVADFNTSFGSTSMYDLIITNVDSYMTIIADHITRQLVCIADGSSCSRQCTGLSRGRDAKMCMDQIHKT